MFPTVTLQHYASGQRYRRVTGVVIWDESRHRRVRIELGDEIAIGIEVEAQPHHELMRRGLVGNKRYAAGQPTNLTLEEHPAKTAHVRRDQGQSQTDNEQYDRQFQQGEPCRGRRAA